MHISFLKKCLARKKSLFTILGRCFFCIALVSCNNFLKGAETRKQLEDSIAYANAKACTLYLKSNPAMGSFLAEGGKEFRVGFATDIQFTLKKNDYYFVSLEAVSVNDEEQSRASYVEFTLDEKASDPDKGIYITKVKLLKETNDIQIRPKCIELPCIKSYSPSGILPNPANTPIVINFNIPVEKTDQTESIFNYTNIKLIDAETINDDEPVSLSECFITPEFNAQKTVLTLFPKGDQIVKYLNRNDKSYVDINVCFSETITVEVDEYTFPIRQDTNSNFIVRYDSDMEVIPPEELDLFVTKEEINLDSAPLLANDKKMELLEYNDDNKNEINEALKDILVSSTIYIYGKYYDKGSGVASIDITESMPASTNRLSGSALGGANFISYILKEKNNNVTYTEDGTGTVSFVIKHTLQESLRTAPRAGLFNIKIQVKDNCGNYAEAQNCCVNYLEYGDLSYHTSWDSSITSGGSYSLNGNTGDIDYRRIKATPFDVCNAPFSKSTDDDTSYDFIKYNSDIKKIRIKDVAGHPSVFFLQKEVIKKDFTDKYYISCNDVVYYCEYVDRNGVTKTEPFSAYNAETLERSVVLDVTSVANMSFYVIAEYNGIQIGKRKFTFPPMVMLNSISDLWIQIDKPDYEVLSPYKPERTCKTIGVCKYSDNNYKLIFGMDNDQYNYQNGTLQKTLIPEGAACYFGYVYMDGATNLNFSTGAASKGLNRYFEEDSEKRWIEKGLLGELLGPYVKTQQEVAKPAKTSTTIEKSKGEEGFVNITLKWDSDLWDKYDYLKVVLDNNNLMITPSNTFNKDDKICYTIPVEITKFFGNSQDGVTDNRKLTYHCRGIKNSFISEQTDMEEQEIGLEIEEKTAFDDIKPSDLVFYSMSSNSTDDKFYLEFCFYDFGSGPASGEFYINDKPQKYEITELFRGKNGYYGTQVELSKFNKTGTNKIDYILKDNKGNTNEGTLTFDLMDKLFLDDKFTSVSVADNKLTVKFSLYISYIKNNDGEIKIYGARSNSYTWTEITTINSDNVGNSSSISDIDLKSYSFIKLVYCGMYLSEPAYCNRVFYKDANNLDPKTGTHCVLPDGSSKDSIIILSSDTRVFTQVYKTTDPDCQNWTEAQWILFANKFVTSGTGVSDEFTANTPTVFKLNTTPNNVYYRIIVHFANGKTSSGQVMHK